MAPLSNPLFVYIFFISSVLCQVEDFISIDCGGPTNHTDQTTGLEWISDIKIMNYGESTQVINNQNEITSALQYQKRRTFPSDNTKYCYRLSTKERRRYLIRATFQYGSSDNDEPYPKFQLYLDATKWTTISIFESSTVYIKEMIIRATSNSTDVCLCCATTGSPFISTLELRPLNLSMYAHDYEDKFFLEVAARVNFGAPSQDAIRYPDDPYDRIWDSDIHRRQNYLVGVATGTISVNTSKNITINGREYPPVKVMQTAVVGTEGVLSYRLNLEDFPANARAYAYFAEIEEFSKNETRKFKLKEPTLSEYNNAVVNIIENANGGFSLYEPSYMNVSLDFVLSFSFVKTNDSTRGPLLNAIEISKYLEITAKCNSKDVTVLGAISSMSTGSNWTNDGGDPCVPTPWEWVTCSSASEPRITKIVLSGKDLKGVIPLELNNMEEITEIWLDGNSLTGPFPDISNLPSLKIVHLENNRLNGSLPSYLGSLPNLKELYIQHNLFTGKIPATLLSGKVIFKYEGNSGLHKPADRKTRIEVIAGISTSVLVVLLVLFVGSLLFMRNLRRKIARKRSDEKDLARKAKPSGGYSIVRGGHLLDEGVAYYISSSELEDATNNFCKKIGKGSFGSVYYGKMKDGKEVAVKTMSDSSTNLTKQFVTEVALLSRIHHRNLVPLIGYCEEERQRILVYEYMHNGTLRDHLYGNSVHQNRLNWLSRLQIAEDAAKGLEYLHTGCNPSIIHRDVKTSNILLDINMRAKLSDFGLSRQAEEDVTQESSVARGTVGYVDPEYCVKQTLTEKSDVYSFGVVLLELISGKKPVSVKDFGDDSNIVHWARWLIRKGDVASIMDPFLVGNVKIESVWRIAEVAIQCVEQHGYSRPNMHEIISNIQDAIKIETENEENENVTSGSSKAQSSRKTLLTSFLEIESPDVSNGSLVPSAR